MTLGKQLAEMPIFEVVRMPGGNGLASPTFQVPLNFLSVFGWQHVEQDVEALICDGEVITKTRFTTDWMRIIGSLGGRLDQMLANIYLLTLPVLENCDVRLVAGRQETCLLIPGTHIVNGMSGDTLSLIPIGGDASGISTEGLVYPLKRETLAFGASRGVSNVMRADAAQITVQTGRLLLVHTLGKA